MAYGEHLLQAGCPHPLESVCFFPGKTELFSPSTIYLYPCCRADNLLRWYAVNVFHPDSHEVRATTGNDEVLKAICPQVAQEFLHGLDR